MVINIINIRNLLLVFLLVVNHAFAESLFTESNYRPLAGDHKAYNVGQILTVLIYEQASAVSSADTSVSKSSGVSASIGSTNTDHEGDLALSNQFQGGGSINRTGNLVASISVTVREIFPTGDMKIEGQQLIHLNDEEQRIKVSGHIRKQDISVNNTVSSTRIANANIEYIGEGLLGGRQSPGIITQFFNWLF